MRDRIHAGRNKASGDRAANRQRPLPRSTEKLPESESKFDPAFHHNMVKQMIKLHLTDSEICQVVGVNLRTWRRWQVDHPSFGQMVSDTRREADDLSEVTLYKRAIGYTRQVQEVLSIRGVKHPVVFTHPEHIPADVAAIELWFRLNKK